MNEFENCINNFASVGLERMKLIGTLCESAMSGLDDSVTEIGLKQVKEELSGVMHGIGEAEQLELQSTLDAVEEENAADDTIVTECSDGTSAVKEVGEFDGSMVKVESDVSDIAGTLEDVSECVRAKCAILFRDHQ